MKIVDLTQRIAVGASLAASGVIHGYLYIHGYRDIPSVGPAFLLQGSVFCALAVLVLAGGPGWLQLIAAIGAAGSLVAFVLSRTGGFFGFTETGWQPAPYAAIAVVAEVLTLLLVGTTALRQRPRTSKDLPQQLKSDI
jgi:NADH:ubiquinone oxidoreductase subunit 6 (subunit J)